MQSNNRLASGQDVFRTQISSLWNTVARAKGIDRISGVSKLASETGAAVGGHNDALDNLKSVVTGLRRDNAGILDVEKGESRYVEKRATNGTAQQVGLETDFTLTLAQNRRPLLLTLRTTDTTPDSDLIATISHTITFRDDKNGMGAQERAKLGLKDIYSSNTAEDALQRGYVLQYIHRFAQDVRKACAPALSCCPRP